MSTSTTFKILTAGLVLLSLFTQPLFAQNNLIYQGNDSSLPNEPRAEEASSRLVPVTHSTNYETEFDRYASFMDSPYRGDINVNYPNAGQMPAPAGYYPQTPQGGTDPFSASEVSPYSRYSPYLEVIGEGSDYTLGIDDVVTIIVRNQPDFSGRFVINPEGKIQYNFVGDVMAEGKTKDELKLELIEHLRKFVRNPELAVMISDYRSKAVYVFGFVNRPGKYAMKGDSITIQEAVVAAGLPRMDGALKRVYVIRPSQYTESGEPEKKKIDLKKLLYKGESAENFILQPGDTLIIDQRYYDKFVNNFTRLVGPMFQAAAVYELGFGGDPNGYLRKDPT